MPQMRGTQSGGVKGAIVPDPRITEPDRDDF